jgi:diacylglycerol kinase family enzyme
MPPDARIDEGLLDVTLLDGENTFHTAWHFLRLGAGVYQPGTDLEHWRGREIAITGATLPIHIDAEPVGTTPIEIQVKPAALRAFVPESANRGLFAAPANVKPAEQAPVR